MPLNRTSDYITDEQKNFLRELYTPHTIDFASFLKKYKRCGADCEQLCCAVGGYLYQGEIEKIKGLDARDDKPVTIPPSRTTIVEFSQQNEFYPTEVLKRTSLKECHYHQNLGADSEGVEYRKTCVYKEETGYCSLQSAAIHQGKHPWTYKPFDCWLFPIVLKKHPDGYTLSIFNNNDGLYTNEVWPGYDQQGSCIVQDDNGIEGYQLLEQELACLSEVLGVDILTRIRSQLGA